MYDFTNIKRSAEGKRDLKAGKKCQNLEHHLQPVFGIFRAARGWSCTVKVLDDGSKVATAP